MRRPELLNRRSFSRLVMAAPLLGAAPRLVRAQDNVTFFRIGTGGISGTYYPIGGLIADIISQPPGARGCGEGGNCGVRGLVAIVQSSQGSVDNIRQVRSGRIESGFAQSDIVHGAATGTGVFSGEPPAEDLRVIASLYTESMHLVASRESGIQKVEDLRGKRVSLDDTGSGTLVDARLILGAYGIREDELEPVYVKPLPALRMMIDGNLDAFFFVAGYPTPSVSELARDYAATLVPLSGPPIDQLIGTHPFFYYDEIPEGTYEGVPATETIGVAAQWIVSASLDETLAYGITSSLWHPVARQLLDQGHIKAQDITLDTALVGVSIPLHAGAARYYRETGMAN